MYDPRRMRGQRRRRRSAGIFFVGGSTGLIGDAGGDVSLPAGTTTNDIVIVVTGGDAGFTSPDGKPTTAGYTQLSYVGDGVPSHYVGYKIMDATPDTVVSIDPAAAGSPGVTVCVATFRGVDVANPIAVAIATATATTGAPNPPSLDLTAGQMSVVVGITEDDVVSSVTEPTDWSNLVWRHDGTVNACQTCMIASRLISADGAYNPGTFTVGVTDDWDAGHFALAPAA